MSSHNPFAALRQEEKFDQQVVFRSLGSAKSEFEGICRRHKLIPCSVHRRLQERFNEQYRTKGAEGVLRLLYPTGKPGKK